MDADIRWVTAAPLWPLVESTPPRMRAPTLLRFASDSFMDDLAELLATKPAQLHDHVATARSYRLPPPGARAGWSPPALAQLKLFQPAHGHFNLVAAHLVCRVAGLPDHGLDAARERVGFVIRRLDANGAELAWVKDPDTGQSSWRTPDGAVDPNEERLPLLPLNFPERGRQRRLLLGLIPTASRETYDQAPVAAATAAAGDDPRVQALNDQLLTLVQAASAPANDPEVLSASLFVLFDLADYLVSGLGSEWTAALESGTAITSGPSAGLYSYLAGATASGTTTWLDALRAVWARRDAITRDGSAGDPPLSFDVRMANEAAVNAFITSVKQVTPTPPAPAATPIARFASNPGARYVLHCVFERPTCRPPHAAVVSDPSDPFTLAPFFDPDAPGRPISIALPEDTSIGGLRKFSKNVQIVMPEGLRNKLQCGEHDLSFSIPIITLCATIVLMIFLVLLNMIFWWLPFLRVCKPKVKFS